MNFRSFGIAGIAALAFAAPAFAHHSFAMFDGAKTISLDGTIKEFEWSNPHAWINIMVPNKDGTPQQWSFEMGSPAQLASKGMKADSLKPGDKVTLKAHPMKDGSRGGQYMSVTLADGQTFGQRPRTAAPPTAKD